MSLTAKKIRDAKPTEKTRIIWDDDLKGFGVRITAAGVKAYILDYRINGVKRRITIARTSELTLPDASDRAAEMLVAIRSGADPMNERQERRAMPTVSEGVERYITDHLPAKMAKGRLAERTAREYTRQLEKYVLPKLRRKRIADVTKADIERVLSPHRQSWRTVSARCCPACSRCSNIGNCAPNIPTPRAASRKPSRKPVTAP